MPLRQATNYHPRIINQLIGNIRILKCAYQPLLFHSADNQGKHCTWATGVYWYRHTHKQDTWETVRWVCFVRDKEVISCWSLCQKSPSLIQKEKTPEARPLSRSILSLSLSLSLCVCVCVCIYIYMCVCVCVCVSPTRQQTLFEEKTKSTSISIDVSFVNIQLPLRCQGGFRSAPTPPIHTQVISICKLPNLCYSSGDWTEKPQRNFLSLFTCAHALTCLFT